MSVYNKVSVNGEVLIDLSSDTVTVETLSEGVTAHNSAGELITGTHKCNGGGGDAAAIVDGILDRSVTEINNNNITRIGQHALRDCTKLKSVKFPNITYIGEYGFYNCTSLETIEAPLVKNFGNYAFEDCENLKSVSFPNITTILANYAFRDCASLTSVDFPNVIQNCDNQYIFYGCTALTNVNLPLAQQFGSNMFAYCTSLETVDFPNLKQMGGNAFKSCRALKHVILRNPNTVCTIASNTFLDSGVYNKTGYVYVPAALLESYKTATYWSNHASQIRAIEDYPEICGTP